MTYFQAVDLLDERRKGANMPAFVVLKALELTGDLKPTCTVLEAVVDILAERELAQ